MQIGTLSKVTARTAEEVCGPASESATPLKPPPGVTPAAFLEQLLSEKKLNDAVHFLAFALPKREAVWWACLCTRLELINPVPPPNLAALEAAEAWVYRPTEDTRRAAMACAQATKFDSPSAWAAMGAFWSGGSMAPAELPAVPPAAHLTGVAVAGAVTLAAVQNAPALADEKRRRYIEMAVDIANGGDGRLEGRNR